jgi:DNA-directed RNA polymerase specialized sigma24 family protein
VSSPGSVTQLIGRFKNGDPSAAQKLWDLFAARLVKLARNRIGRHVLAADEEDVALSALNMLFIGIERERFPRLDNRHDLWRLLSTMANRKTNTLVKQETREKRGGGRPSAMENDPSPDAIFHDVVDPAPPPDIRAVLEDACEEILRALGARQLRSVAIWKMEGFQDHEIAAKLGCSVRTVERKVRLIRTIWRERTLKQRRSRSASSETSAPSAPK